MDEVLHDEQEQDNKDQGGDDDDCSSSKNSSHIEDPLKNLDVSHIAIGSLLGKVKIYKFRVDVDHQREDLRREAHHSHFLEDHMTIQLKGFSTALTFSMNNQLAYNSTKAFKVVDMIKPSVMLHSFNSDKLICSIKYISIDQIVIGHSNGRVVFFDTRCGPKNNKNLQLSSKSEIRNIFCDNKNPNDFYCATYSGSIYKYDSREDIFVDINQNSVNSRLAFADLIENCLLMSDEIGNIAIQNIDTGCKNKIIVGTRDFDQSSVVSLNSLNYMKHQFRFTPAVTVAKKSYICLFSSLWHHKNQSTYYHLIKLSLNPFMPHIEDKQPEISTTTVSNNAFQNCMISPVRQDIEYNCVKANPLYSSPIGNSNLIIVGYVGSNASINYFDDCNLRLKLLTSIDDTSSASCVAFI